MKLRILELNKHNFYGNMVSKPEGDAGIDLYFPNDVNGKEGLDLGDLKVTKDFSKKTRNLVKTLLLVAT